LRHLEKGNALRRSHAAQFDRALKGLEEIVTPYKDPYARHVYHIYAIRVRERDEVVRQLGEMGIACGIHYPVPVHLQEAYSSLGYEAGSFPIAEQVAKEFVSLPMFPELTPAQIDMVAEGVKGALNSQLSTLNSSRDRVVAERDSQRQLSTFDSQPCFPHDSTSSPSDDLSKVRRAHGSD
jgi:dTDP-4-amino-4,6-dideoxygalactose transaminase